MKELNFHEFYDYIWEDDVLEIIVSTKYIEENKEFLEQLTLDYFRLYTFADLKPSYIKKAIEIMFSNLFAFQPGIENIKEIKDNYPDLLGGN